MKNHLVIFIFFLLLCNFTTKANKVDTLEHPPKNTIYASISNLGLWLTSSAYYERYTFRTDKRFNVNYYARAGGGVFAGWGYSGNMGIVSLQAIFGEEKKHLELGLGFAALYDPSEYSFAVNSRNFDHDANPMPSKWSLTDKFLAGTIGYRYQTPDDFLLFRIGLSSPEGAYMTFGMAF